MIAGGGDVALDVAKSAKQVGAERIDRFCLEMPDQVVCSQENIAASFREGTFMHHCTRLSEINVERGKPALVVTQKIRCEVPGSLDSSNALIIPRSDFALRADKLILGIGSRIAPDLAQHLKDAGIHLARGMILTDGIYATSAPGIVDMSHNDGPAQDRSIWRETRHT